MPARRLVTALRELFRRPEGKAEVLPAVELPGPPVPSEPPGDWRVYRCMAGPYWRFAVRYPRSWNLLTPGDGEGELVHLEPGDGTDLAITLSTLQEPVVGPQGLLDAIAGLAEARGITIDRNQVELDRWGEDGWASSWGWQEEADGGGIRTWRLMLLGHDQGMVFVMANGAQKILSGSRDLLDQVFGSVRLPPAYLHAPESFPLSLLEVLNDRRSDGEEAWYISEAGHLQAGELVVRLPNVYRIHLGRDLDIDELASLIESQQQSPLHENWAERDWVEVASCLRVVLRRQDALEEMDVVAMPLPEGLVACPVLDSETRITFIPTHVTERWGMDSRSLLTQAIARMEAHSNVPLDELRDDETGSLYGYRIAGDDGYDSGRLLCDGLRSRLETLLGGPLLVAMPAARQVFVLRDDKGLRAALAETAEASYGRKAWPLSRNLWLWTEDGLVPLPG